MYKKVVLIFAVLVALLAFTSPALALAAPGTYYVNTAYTGTEVGSPTQPFNTLDEAISAAQNNPYGGYIYTWNATSSAWVYYGYIATVVPPDTGVALSGPALDRTTIAVSTGRFCEFARVLDWGGWSLNVAIARELDRAPSEVEAVKRRLSFAAQSDIDGLTPEQAVKAREAIQRSLAAFVPELVASLQFYQAQPGALGIGEVVLTGGTAHMDGLPEALGALVGVPIRLGDPFKRVKVGPKVAYEGPRGSLSVAVGLGIED